MRPQRPGNFRTLLRNVLVTVLLVAGIGWGVAGFGHGQAPGRGGATVRSAPVIRGAWQKIAGLNWKYVLNSGIPVMKTTEPQSYSGGLKLSDNLLENCLFFLTGVKVNNPANLLRQEIPLMSAVMPVTADSMEEFTEQEDISLPPAVEGPSGTLQPTVENKVYSDDTLIALYSTHSSETYELTDGLTHLKGKPGGVTKAAAELARGLRETYGIKVAYNEKLHDISFGKSYVESEKTVKQLVKENPKLRMLIDVHRDGILPRERTVVKIGGEETAKILLIVGTDARAAHPNWRKNLEFARKVAAAMDRLYPGLSRGIAIKDGRYNQQYHQHGLLVEIGSAKNSTDEAVRSAKLLTNVLVAVLNEK